MSKIYLTIIFLQIIITQCQNCLDESCSKCTKDRNDCFKCKKGFILHYSKCGKKCNSIINCKLCNADETKCIRCKSNCIFNGIYCDCTERYVLAFVCTFFSISMISIIAFFLMHTSYRRRPILRLFSNNVTSLNINNNSITRYQLPEEVNVDISNKKNEINMIDDFNKNKTELDKDIENKKCVICKSNTCNLKLGCGCFICYECEQKCIKVNICLNCKTKITTMQQVSCSICFCNKKELSTFNCPCKIVICKECYLKWRKNNNFCPSCRGPII